MRIATALAASQLTVATPAAGTPAKRLPQWHPVARGRTGRSPNLEEVFGAREDGWEVPTVAWTATVVHVSEILGPGSFPKQNES